MIVLLSSASLGAACHAPTSEASSFAVSALPTGAGKQAKVASSMAARGMNKPIERRVRFCGVIGTSCFLYSPRAKVSDEYFILLGLRGGRMVSGQRAHDCRVGFAAKIPG